MKKFFIYRRTKTATNKSICKSRAGHCNINYLQASAAVPVDEFHLAYSCYLQLYIFNWAFVPGWTSNEFPAFANTQSLCARPFGRQFFMQRLNYKKTQLLLTNIKMNSVKEMTCLIFVHSDLFIIIKSESILNGLVHGKNYKY
ncbi:MAG: hypothetical protein H0U27_02975 [Nitrosopumilus sp.]|nr:hypothetical protein [Nitrosopumilus sp.]